MEYLLEPVELSIEVGDDPISGNFVCHGCGCPDINLGCC